METINNINSLYLKLTSKHMLKIVTCIVYLGYRFQIVFSLIVIYFIYLSYKIYSEFSKNILQTINKDEYFEMVWKTMISSPLILIINSSTPIIFYFFPHYQILTIFIQMAVIFYVRYSDFKCIYDFYDIIKFDIQSSEFYFNYSESVLKQNKDEDTIQQNPIEKMILNYEKNKKEKTEQDASNK